MSDGELPIATYVAPQPELDLFASTAVFEAPPDPTDTLIPPAKNLKSPKIMTDSIDVQQLFIQGVGLTQQSVAQLQLQVNTLNTISQTHTSEIDTLTQQLSNLDGEIVSLDTNLATLTANLGLTDGKVTTLEGKVDTLETNVADTEMDVQTINTVSLPEKQNISEKNQNNGYAGLSSTGQLNPAQVPRAGTTQGFWYGDTVVPISDRTQAVVVRDSVDNKLKPLTPEVIGTYWHMGAVADGITANATDIGILYADKADASTVSTLSTQVSTNTSDINTINTTSLPAKANASDLSALTTRVTTAEGNITTNTSAISTINTTSLPAKQDISGKNVANGYVGIDASLNIGIQASNVRRGGCYLTNVCRLGIIGADYAPGTNSGTISAWRVLTDTFYNYNNAYGAGFKGTTNKSVFKAARDAIISVKGCFTYNISSANSGKFFTILLTPVNTANTPTPYQYNYAQANNITGNLSFCFAVDIPMRTGDSLQFQWTFGQNPTFLQDYTYVHITEASNGLIASDWFP